MLSAKLGEALLGRRGGEVPPHGEDLPQQRVRKEPAGGQVPGDRLLPVEEDGGEDTSGARSPSPSPTPPLTHPALPCPTLPCPALPCPTTMSPRCPPGGWQRGHQLARGHPDDHDAARFITD